MRPIIIAALLLALSCAPALATDDSDETESSRVYDAKGRYQGRISEKSNGDAVIYDAQGKFQGRIRNEPSWPHFGK
jgi:hypothetical protein